MWVRTNGQQPLNQLYEDALKAITGSTTNSPTANPLPKPSH
jgi:hypothetical protein